MAEHGTHLFAGLAVQGCPLAAFREQDTDDLHLWIQILLDIHASLEEPFGIPPLDAMASEKVVIVSDGVKSTDRLIENGVNGYIYPAEDSDRLCEILSNLNKIDFARIGEQARKDVISKYDLSANMKSIEECLLEKRTR